IFALHSFSQINPCDNLVNTIYTDAQIIKPDKTSNPPLLYGKPGVEILDVSYINDSLGSKQCSVSTTCTDGNTGLQYEVYYPNIDYAQVHLPAMIFFHAGGFSDCSGFDHDGGLTLYCNEFVKRGFIVFNIEYRRGRVKDPDGKYISASQELATYRAF